MISLLHEFLATDPSNTVVFFLLILGSGLVVFEGVLFAIREVLIILLKFWIVLFFLDGSNSGPVLRVIALVLGLMFLLT